MPFDEEELDPHGECAAEIAGLRAEIERLRAENEQLRKDFRSLARVAARIKISAADEQSAGKAKE